MIAYSLPGPIAAGPWRLVADGYVSAAPEIKFDLALRAMGAPDAPIVSFDHQYPVTADGAVAQYDESEAAPAIAAHAGDALVFTMALVGDGLAQEFVPIGERDSTPSARRLSIDVP